MRPGESSVLIREFATADTQTPRDFLCRFLVLPIGFAGPPGYFSRTTEAIRSIHKGFGPENPIWNTSVPYEAEFSVADAIFAGPMRGLGREGDVDNSDWACNLI